jgi:hypothetical protein
VAKAARGYRRLVRPCRLGHEVPRFKPPALTRKESPAASLDSTTRSPSKQRAMCPPLGYATLTPVCARRPTCAESGATVPVPLGHEDRLERRRDTNWRSPGPSRFTRPPHRQSVLFRVSTSPTTTPARKATRDMVMEQLMWNGQAARYPAEISRQLKGTALQVSLERLLDHLSRSAFVDGCRWPRIFAGVPQSDQQVSAVGLHSAHSAGRWPRAGPISAQSGTERSRFARRETGRAF